MIPVKRIDFFIVNKCVNKCVFCSESYRMDGSEMDVEYIKKVLIEEKLKGAKLVQFTGGEPTLHSLFPQVVRFAKELGYRTFIITNGVMFSSNLFCKKVLPFLDEIMFSIHGPNEIIHDAITRNKGSFKKLIKGIENVKNYCNDTSIKATTCIINNNINNALEIITLINEFNIKDYQWMTVVPGGRGKENFYQLMPRLNILKKKIEEAIRLCEKYGIMIRFSGVPMCILSNHYILSHDIHEAMKVDNVEFHSGKVELWREPGKYDSREFRIDMARIKPKKCKECLKNNICGGIYYLYYQKYGDSELKPFKE